MHSHNIFSRYKHIQNGSFNAFFRDRIHQNSIEYLPLNKIASDDIKCHIQINRRHITNRVRIMYE